MFSIFWDKKLFNSRFNYAAERLLFCNRLIALSQLEVISGITKLLRLPANMFHFFSNFSLSPTNVRKAYTIKWKMQYILLKRKLKLAMHQAHQYSEIKKNKKITTNKKI